jgi:fructose-bisphosphate aldolase class II
MPLTHTKDLFAKALKGKYALGAFNVNNMELIQAIVEACEEEKAPLMLQISKGARRCIWTTATRLNCARNASMRALPAS